LNNQKQKLAPETGTKNLRFRREFLRGAVLGCGRVRQAELHMRRLVD
jgi:hypothetical protein